MIGKSRRKCNFHAMQGRWLFLGLLIVLTGCPEEAEVDPIVGKWETYYSNHQGSVSSGPAFHGTTYEFRQDGIVKVWIFKGDSSQVRYEHRGDTLVYIGENEQLYYRIDSLNDKMLQISVSDEGAVSFYKMRKIKD